MRPTTTERYIIKYERDPNRITTSSDHRMVTVKISIDGKYEMKKIIKNYELKGRNKTSAK